jgi:hypothetical protein
MNSLNRILFLASVALAVLVLLSACAQLDRAAEATTQATNDPLTGGALRSVAGPYSELIVGGLGALATLYLELRRRKWKSAFQTVVTTVAPYIPADEVEREKLKAAQGEAVTAKVKAALNGTVETK